MQTVVSVAIALAVLALVTYKQSRWQPVTPSRLIRMPLIFLVAGVLQVPESLQQLPAGWHLDGLDLALVAIELLAAVGAGWGMGRLTEVRSLDGVSTSRLGRTGIAVWLGFVALRIRLELLGSAVSAPLAVAPATIFFLVATIKIVQAVVLRNRLFSHAGPAHEVRPAPAVGRAAAPATAPVADAGWQ